MDQTENASPTPSQTAPPKRHWLATLLGALVGAAVVVSLTVPTGRWILGTQSSSLIPLLVYPCGVVLAVIGYLAVTFTFKLSSRIARGSKGPE